MNQEAWLQGIYFANALGSMVSKKITYPKTPYSMSDDIEEQEKEDQPHPHALLFEAWAIEHNQKFKQKER
jgi:hypothetical protein